MGNEQESLLTESEWRKDALRWFLAHVVEPNLAEDLAQETLLRLLRCQRRQQVITWAYLHRTYQSVLCDHKRRCERELPLLSLDVCCLCAVAERGYEQVEIQLLLEQALAQLKPLARAIVERHYLQEQTFDAIGKELGIPTERVKKICQRSIKKLQQWAQSGGGGGDNAPETLSLIGDAERSNRWRWLNGKRASDRTRSSATVLATRYASSVGSDRGHMVDRAGRSFPCVGGASVADRCRCGFGQGATEPDDFASGVGIQSVVALCFDRSDALVWLHGGEVTASAVDAVERFSCGGAGWDLGFAVGLSGEGGGLECLFGWWFGWKWWIDVPKWVSGAFNITEVDRC